MDLSIRSYRQGDAPQIIELWNRTYASLGGMNVRTLEYWNWTILERPGMHSNDVLLLENNGSLVAYGALWRDGIVLEIAVTPAVSTRLRSKILQRLIVTLEESARNRGDDMITFCLPVSDALIDSALRKDGYVAEHQDNISLGIIDPKQLILKTAVALQFFAYSPAV